MNAEWYLNQILAKVSQPTEPERQGPAAQFALTPTIQKWAGSELVDITLSGSYAKATAVRGGTDVDLFISLSHNSPRTLGQTYLSLANFMEETRL